MRSLLSRNTRRVYNFSKSIAVLCPTLTTLAIVNVSFANDSEPSSNKYQIAKETQIIGEEYSVTLTEDITLLDIAREHGVGYEEIRAANPDTSLWTPGEGAEIIIPARHILPNAPQEGIVINLAELRLYYYPPTQNEATRWVETYPIGIGRDGFNTPLGITQTTMRLENPAWYPPRSMREEAAQRGDPPPSVVPPGPDNPLGSHAILLDLPGYLIHGTNRPDGIGMRASRGCIRMHAEDIEALFEKIPNGTQVNVIDENFKVAWENDRLYVQSFSTLSYDRKGIDALLSSLTRLAEVTKEKEASVDYIQLLDLLTASDRNINLLYPIERRIEYKPNLYEEIEKRWAGIYQSLPRQE
ncbi:L,D-transpeptidase family protein [Billgrantia lactosivorans]|uniref:L,D-transpeptidase family protein n=1 Tax=Billgrantia lactosivorans TaxID=2185141 RepID=UPI000DADF8CC|nr:L,D-transpeptidase family protein [Halomonas lactosivorans]